jgi:hypothetical protein
MFLIYLKNLLRIDKCIKYEFKLKWLEVGELDDYKK